MKNIILFGSTGSVGKNVLEVARAYPKRFRIKAISSYGNIELLSEQAKEFSPEFIGIGLEERASELRSLCDDDVKILAGCSGLEELAGEEADIVFMAISGTASLNPLVRALEKGRTVALASKEPIVSAGSIINRIASDNSAKILPVDSEHSAIMQCMTGRSSSEVRTLYVTGSGGSLMTRDALDFESLTVEEVLDHPKWDMGPKITVDSATLMNKGLEVIEARWLFDIPPEKIKVVIHPEAIIHSMVEFLDGTISAGLFAPDMRFPILKALAHPEIVESDLPRVDFADIGKFTFTSPDFKRFPALDLAFEALRQGGTAPAVLNGANEAAVKLFLGKKIKFTEIFTSVESAINKHKNISDPTLSDVIEAERWGSEEVLGRYSHC